MIGRLRRLLAPVQSFTDPVRNPEASEFEVDLWELSRFVVERCLPTIGVHPYPLNEQLLAAAAACRLRPGVVFDWGTHRGASARMLWECAKAFRLGYDIHTIDLPPDVAHVEHPGQAYAVLLRGLAEVHLHRGDGVTIALTQWEKLAQPPRPLFFIDGDHAYESVATELRRVFDAIADASALVHDTFFQSADAGYNVGPALAVRDVVAEQPGRFKVMTSGLGLPGMTLIASTAALSSAAVKSPEG